MYICCDCRETFDEPDTYCEQHPYGDTYAEEEFSCCPYCGSGNYDTAVECAECGEIISYEEMMDDVCPDCFHKMEELEEEE